MAKELKKYSTDELRSILIAAVVDELKARGQEVPEVPATPTSAAHCDSDLANALLGDAAIAYLESCDEPQSAKQIWRGLEKAGRKPDSDNPVKAVTWALRKLVRRHPDLIHIGYGTWHVKSKYKSKAKLEKLKAKGAGKGGRTTAEHAERTLAGMQKAKEKGRQIGATRKMTAEVKERALDMLMERGATAKSVAAALGVAVVTLYANKVNHQTAKEHFLSKIKVQNGQGVTATSLRVVK